MGSPLGDGGGASSLSAREKVALRAWILTPNCFFTRAATSATGASRGPAILRTAVAMAAAEGKRSSVSKEHARDAMSVSASAHFASALAPPSTSRRIAPTE